MSGRERPLFSQMPASMSRMVRPGRARAKEAVPSGRYTQQYFPGRFSLSPSPLPRLFRWLWLWARADRDYVHRDAISWDTYIYTRARVHLEASTDMSCSRNTGMHTQTCRHSAGHSGTFCPSTWRQRQTSKF